MADRIWLDMQDLEIVNDSLKASITEFTDVADSNDANEEAVGRPAGRGDLRDRMHDFEADWNNNREKLTENLKKVQEHLQGIIDGFNELDTELNSSLSSAEQELLSNSGRNNQPV
jgi:predicted  nucleic acid-binding Zn-ribbon protein